MGTTQKEILSKDVLTNFKTFIDLANLPDDLNIATITVTCRMNTKFNVDNIGRYIDLMQDGIICVKYGKLTNNCRSLIVPKKKAKKKKKVKKTFFNQVSVVIKTSHPKPTNVKLFKNGAIQITGCKGLLNFMETFTILCRELKRVKGILDPITLSSIEPKPFVSNPENIDISKIKNLKIAMINSGFKIGFNVDRRNFYNILKSQDIDCTYEPCVHACVNIKYNYKDMDKISIFVFEKGSIIITGAKHRAHIVEAYEFITKKMYENYNEIVKKDINVFLKRPDIKSLLELDSDEEIKIVEED